MQLTGCLYCTPSREAHQTILLKSIDFLKLRSINKGLATLVTCSYGI